MKNEPTDELLKTLFECIDAMDTDGVLALLAPDARYRFASAPEIQGHDEIREAFEGVYASIAGIRHQLLGRWDGEGSLVVEGLTTYTRHDGSEVIVPFCDVFELDGGLVSSYRIYADLAPLFEGAPAEAGN
ncbi:MAG: nuclear transport factor 2 family protein [Gammaproteobacteria bacterium]